MLMQTEQVSSLPEIQPFATQSIVPIIFIFLNQCFRQQRTFQIYFRNYPAFNGKMAWTMGITTVQFMQEQEYQITIIIMEKCSSEAMQKAPTGAFCISFDLH